MDNLIRVLLIIIPIVLGYFLMKWGYNQGVKWGMKEHERMMKDALDC